MSKTLLFGAHSVREWLEADPSRIEAVIAVQNANDRVNKILALAQKHHVPIERISSNKLRQLAHPKNPQGIAARVRPFEYENLETVLHAGGDFLLAVDGVTDPGNLGAIIRSASFFGVSAVILPADSAAAITPTVERSAAGAVARIPICEVNSIRKTLESMKSDGFTIVGTIPGPHPNPSELDLNPPLVLVVGSEGKGIRPSVRRLCDTKTSLPTKGPQSLNVSAFTSVILYEVFRQNH